MQFRLKVKRLKPGRYQTRGCTCVRGFSLFDLMSALAVTGVLSAAALPVGRSSVSTYQLDSAVQTLSRDLEQARLKALESNTEVVVVRESDDTYAVAGRVRRLPGGVRFSEVSADSVVFAHLGALKAGVAQTIVLVSRASAEAELRVGVAGAVEVVK